MLEIIKAIIIGIIEGITEWLPVSSTGHMILAEEFIKLNVSKEFNEMFLVVIQLGAILAVCILFFDKLYPFSKRNVKLLIYGGRLSLDVFQLVYLVYYLMTGLMPIFIIHKLLQRC